MEFKGAIVGQGKLFSKVLVSEDQMVTTLWKAIASREPSKDQAVAFGNRLR